MRTFPLLTILLILVTASPSFAANKCASLFAEKRATSIIEGDNESLFSLKGLEARDPSDLVQSTSSSIRLSISPERSSTFDFPFKVQSSVLSRWQLTTYINRHTKGLHPFKTTSENLEDTNYPFHENPLLGVSILNFRSTYLNPKPVLEWASFSFLAQVKAPKGTANQNYKVRVKAYFETSLTRQMSIEKQRPIRYEHEFLVGSAADWVSLRLSDFKLSSDSDGPNFSEVAHEPVQFGFEVLPDTKLPKNLVLALSDKAAFSLDIKNHEIPQFIDNLFFNRESAFYSPRHGERPSEQYIKSALKKFFLNMQSIDLQNQVLPIVRQGLPAIQEAFAAYGWKVQTQFADKASMLDIVTTVSSKDLFYEEGSFGPLHGSFAHHAQILTGLKGLSPTEAKLVLDFISGYIAETTQNSQWPIWNALFDSRGYGVNGNRYWRDRINQSPK